jgi:hypothetical protein
MTRQLLESRHVDGVLYGAGLRAPEHLLLFERLRSVVHARAPDRVLGFNTSPADTAEAVRRSLYPARARLALRHRRRTSST